MIVRNNLNDMPLEVLNNISSFLDGDLISRLGHKYLIKGVHVTERSVNKFAVLNKKFFQIYKNRPDLVKNVLNLKTVIRLGLIFGLKVGNKKSFIDFLFDPAVGPSTCCDNRLVMNYALTHYDKETIRKVLDSGFLDIETRKMSIQKSIKNNQLDILRMLMIPDKNIKSSALNNAVFFGTQRSIQIIMDNSRDVEISLLARHNVVWKLEFNRGVLGVRDVMDLKRRQWGFIKDSKMAITILAIEFLMITFFQFYVIKKVVF